MTLKMVLLLPPLADVKKIAEPISTVVLVTYFVKHFIAFQFCFGKFRPVVNVTGNNDNSWVW